MLTQAVISQILARSNEWFTAEDVMASMKTVSLCDLRLKPIAIGPKVLAGLLLQSKNTYFDKQKLEAARVKASEAAEEYFRKRLGRMYVEHKAQNVRVSKELEDRLREVGKLKCILEIRLQAAKTLDDDEVDKGKLHEELLKENGVLREQNSQAIQRTTANISGWYSVSGTSGSETCLLIGS
jgi:hypothetical protein